MRKRGKIDLKKSEKEKKSEEIAGPKTKMGQSVLGVETAAYNLELSVEASTGKDEPDHGSQGVGNGGGGVEFGIGVDFDSGDMV